ncbi:MAG TPA: hypothetical protein VM709_00770, partial [Candidatus Sulfotelmatobacter sp.]|nr:hypothetical protein [Candidatus Sulfotelmatobacter sp.]
CAFKQALVESQALGFVVADFARVHADIGHVVCVETKIAPFRDLQATNKQSRDNFGCGRISLAI